MLFSLLRVVWAILAVSHLYFLAKLMGDFRVEMATMGDAFRLTGLILTIILSTGEALGLGILRRFGVLENWRRATAFWVIVMLLHAGIPMRHAEMDKTLEGGAPWAGVVLVIPLTAALALEALMAKCRRRRLESEVSPVELCEAKMSLSRSLRRLWETPRPLHDRERCDIERRCALAPPHAC